MIDLSFTRVSLVSGKVITSPALVALNVVRGGDAFLHASLPAIKEANDICKIRDGGFNGLDAVHHHAGHYMVTIQGDKKTGFRNMHLLMT